ncbi:hypothetical protein N7509_008164 [Penicillium cosmopolitanum]|uniref:Uncharacterized protein n=1 Tax=Penicillium cosmopolitanum TaxID=1131564 RepID=A0A9X0B924_9EURO|nr:uncharacterized protein N7509_008164 [Penicillium cosmopolitanum]KAJ5392674.1 hypothetical protein N7509_008164 [Penicillium cosmopolitanum]
MADVSAELLRQNEWCEGAKVKHPGWLTRPGIWAECLVLNEFTSPAVLSSVESYEGSKSTRRRASVARDG